MMSHIWMLFLEAVCCFIILNRLRRCVINFHKNIKTLIIKLAFTRMQVMLCPTDLRAAGGAAHIRPVLFVIHVIHTPTQTEESRTMCQCGAWPPRRGAFVVPHRSDNYTAGRII